MDVEVDVLEGSGARLLFKVGLGGYVRPATPARGGKRSLSGVRGCVEVEVDGVIGRTAEAFSRGHGPVDRRSVGGATRARTRTMHPQSKIHFRKGEPPGGGVQPTRRKPANSPAQAIMIPSTQNPLQYFFLVPIL